MVAVGTNFVPKFTLRKLAVNSYKFASCLINLHQKALVGSIKLFTHWALEKMGAPWKRAKTSFIALWVLFWDVVLVIVVGVIFGGICLCLLLFGLVLLICWYSPWLSLMLVYVRKLTQMDTQRKPFFSRFFSCTRSGNNNKLLFGRGPVLSIYHLHVWLSYFRSSVKRINSGPICNTLYRCFNEHLSMLLQSANALPRCEENYFGEVADSLWKTRARRNSRRSVLAHLQ